MTLRSTVSNGYHVFRMLFAGAPLRHAMEWARSTRTDYLTSRPSPWMTFGAIEYLRVWMQRGMRVFEYGSGGSTLFWLEAGAEVISIEHDRTWYESQLPLLKGRSVDYRCVPPDPRTASGTPDPADPGHYATEDAALSGKEFRTYVTQIDAIADDSLDLVCIDGRSRPACIVHSIRKVRKGGIILLDNSEREYYLRLTAHSLSGFRRTDFEGFIPCIKSRSTTTIFVRER